MVPLVTQPRTHCHRKAASKARRQQERKQQQQQLSRQESSFNRMRSDLSLHSSFSSMRPTPTLLTSSPSNNQQQQQQLQGEWRSLHTPTPSSLNLMGGLNPPLSAPPPSSASMHTFEVDSEGDDRNS